MGSQKVSVCDEHTSSTKPADTFVVDMERFSHLLERDLTANSRIKVSSIEICISAIYNTQNLYNIYNAL